METAYNVLLVLGLIVAVLFAGLVFITGKGDAMSGSGGIRTTFKGKASIEDMIGRTTLFLGIGFMGLMIVLNVLANQLPKK